MQNINALKLLDAITRMVSQLELMQLSTQRSYYALRIIS